MTREELEQRAAVVAECERKNAIRWAQLFPSREYPKEPTDVTYGACDPLDTEG